jgi:hypothetical protein
MLCGWNTGAAAPAAFSVPVQSTIRQGGERIQSTGAPAHLKKLKSTQTSKHIHGLSPAVLPAGLSALILSPAALAGAIQPRQFPANSGRADHSRAPPALV